MSDAVKPCRTCGDIMSGVHPRRLDCDECSHTKNGIGAKKAKEYQRKYRKEYRERLLAEKKKPPPRHKIQIESEFERITGTRRDTSCDKSGYF